MLGGHEWLKVGQVPVPVAGRWLWKATLPVPETEKENNARSLRRPRCGTVNDLGSNIGSAYLSLLCDHFLQSDGSVQSFSTTGVASPGYQHTNPDAYPAGYLDTHGYANRYAYAHADVYEHANPDRYADADVDAHTDFHAYAHSYSATHKYSYAASL